MRISDWSSDVCSSDLGGRPPLSRSTKRPPCYRARRPFICVPLLSGKRRHPRPELAEQAVADRGLARGDIVRLERIAREVEELRARPARLGEQLPIAFADREGRRLIARSEERRVGKGGVSQCETRWAPYQ